MPDYVKRIRMRRTLAGWLPEATLPPGFHWEPWNDSLTDTHAGVKFLSFEDTIDAQLFPNLAGLTGCRLLMHCIRECEGFCPAASWLLMGCDGAIGTIQGIAEEGRGSIQNVGVLPAYRRRGFGAALVARALRGFHDAGVHTAFLEVTANNPNASRLYRRLGFKPYNSFYRELKREPAAAGASL